MCGIFGYIGQKPINSNLVFDGLKELEYRGYDSWGIALDQKEKLDIHKYLGKLDHKPTDLPVSNIAIGHTRWATHGNVTINNCHPHCDSTGNIAIVHNGIVENYEELKNELISRGHKFISETDSEVIAHLVEDLGSVKLAFKKLKGMNAIVVLKHNSNQLVVVKNGSPLVIGTGKNINYISSDINSMFPYTNKFIFLEDNKIYNITSQKIKNKNIVNLKKPLIDGSLNQYPNYLIKEISEQPSILKLINNNFDNTEINKIFSLIKSKDKIFFTGCGTAYFAALFCANLLSQKLAKPIICLPASEMNLHLGAFDKNSLLVAFSQSGETADLINLFNESKGKKIIQVSLVNVANSTLHRISKHCQLLPCGVEKCVLSTKSFTAQIAIFLKLLNIDLDSAIKSLEIIINNKKIRELTKILSKKEHLYLIGRGLSLPIALESALKIKEVSYIHADAFAGAELKHGSIALIETGTPCIVFAPKDENYQNIINNATEIKARGGYIIGLSFENNSVFDYYLNVPDCGLATCLPQVVTCQLLAYYLSLIKGLDPDKPRNLAKCVTVK